MTASDIPEPAGYDAFMAPPRPKSVTVVSVLGIVFGSLGCLCTAGFYVVGLAMSTAEQRAAVPGDIAVYQLILVISGLVLSILLLVASIAALRLTPWARAALIAFSVVDLLRTAAILAFTFAWFIPRMVPVWENDPNMRANPKMPVEQMVKFAKYSTMGMTLAISLITISFALTALIVMSRAEVKRAFEFRPEGAAM